MVVSVGVRSRVRRGSRINFCDVRTWGVATRLIPPPLTPLVPAAIPMVVLSRRSIGRFRLLAVRQKVALVDRYPSGGALMERDPGPA